MAEVAEDIVPLFPLAKISTPLTPLGQTDYPDMLLLHKGEPTLPWQKLTYREPSKEEAKPFLGEAKFYADYNVDDSIVLVLKHLGYNVETAQEIAAEKQPDQFHFKRAFQTKRILLTQDKDFLNDDLFPLSQTRGVFIFDINTASTSEIARTLEVVDTILGETAPAWNQKKIVLHSDYTVTVICRVCDEGEWVVQRTRYKFDENGQDIWIWED